MLVLIVASAAVSAVAKDLSLFYPKPATNWLAALPIGNGSLGAMLFGGTTNERVQFNEQTLWLGSETEMGSYQPFGDVFIEWQHGAATDHRRELRPVIPLVLPERIEPKKVEAAMQPSPKRHLHPE